MKVLMVLTYYHPHWTGLTAYALRLAEGLVGLGHQVTVLTSQHEPSLAPAETIHGVQVIRLPVLKRISRGVLMPRLPATLWRLMQGADIVQIHTPLLEAPLVALYGRLLRRPVIFTHHGDLVMPDGLFNQTVERLVTGLMTQALRLTTQITVHSCDYATHSRFLSPFSAKLDCIYPPIRMPLPDLSAVAVWQQALGLYGRPIIGFAGRWVEEKGFDYLLQAIPRILVAIPDAQFVYAGDPNVVYEDFFSHCQAYLKPVAERVTFVGLLREPQALANFYGLCDVFVLPSRTDCFPSTQIEAMLCGTPVVAADIPGAREPVQVTQMGRLVAPRDPAAIAAGVLDVLEHRADFVRPRAEIEAIFNLERSLLTYEQLMLDLTNQIRPVSPPSLALERERE